MRGCVAVVASIAGSRASAEILEIVGSGPAHCEALPAGSCPGAETAVAACRAGLAEPGSVRVIASGAGRETAVVEVVQIHRTSHSRAVLGRGRTGYAGGGAGLAEVRNAGVDELARRTGSRTDSGSDLFVEDR
jgi:hypothetical protein